MNIKKAYRGKNANGSSRRFDECALEELYRGSIFEFFSQTPYVNNLLIRFREIGIRTIGDLVSFQERELYRIVQATPSAQKRVRAALNECGLDFRGNKPPSLRPVLKSINRALEMH